MPLTVFAPGVLYYSYLCSDPNFELGYVKKGILLFCNVGLFFILYLKLKTVLALL